MRRRPHAASVVVAAVTLVVAALLAYAAFVAHDRNEDHLLRQQVRQAGAVLTTANGSIAAPRAAAAAVVANSSDPTAAFSRMMSGSVGPGKQFVSAALWRMGSPQPSVVVGPPPVLAADPARANGILARAGRTPQFAVGSLLADPVPRLAYALSSPLTPGTAVYAEAALPKDRVAVTQRNNAYDNVDYAIYLGRSARPSALLVADTRHLPLSGRTSSTVVAFGDTNLLLVFTPKGELGGWILANLFWIVGAAGVLLAAGGLAITESLARRRQRAADLARLNEELYAGQREIAVSLQRSLLPKLPDLEAGLEVAARYEPAAQHTEVGGDWYDVVARSDASLVLVVGDVAGHGLDAAAAMAELRFAARAYAVEGYSPAEILSRLGSLIDTREGGRFATTLCAELQPKRKCLAIASAGHPRPVLVDEGGARFVDVPVGPPLGVPAPSGYPSVMLDVGDRGELFAFTDGLFECRGEPVDVGLARLLGASAPGVTPHDDVPLAERLEQILGGSCPTDHDDDVVLLATRWQLGAAPGEEHAA